MRQISRGISWLFACILASVIALGTVPGVALAAKVSYIDVGGGSASADAVEITAEMTSWGGSGEAWYVAQGDVTIGSRVSVTGDVCLILADDATLTVSGGIRVSDGNSLTIYGQERGTGKLTATGGDGNAGIGGNYGYPSDSVGAITINGGTVVAGGGDVPGGSAGAGIGSGISGSGGAININGGTVTATGGYNAAGIGGGTSSTPSFAVTITGGTVTATGGGRAVGIGGSVTSSTGGTFSTGEDGDAVIFANSIGNQSNKGSWSGVIFEGTNGQVYASGDGVITVLQNWNVPAGYTLTVPWDVTLEIPAGTRLDVEGTLINEGTIEVAGTLDWNDASLTNNGVVTALDGGSVTPEVPVFANKLAVTGGVKGTDYDLRGAVVIILKGTPLTVTGAADEERIVVNSGVDANLTLDGVTIDIQSSHNAIDLLDGANLKLTLAGENTLKPGGGKAGIHVPSGTSLVIDGSGSLFVDGGRVGATVAGGAGIGADNGGDLGDITINGGTVVAQSTNGGSAGIGEGGWRSPTITSGSSVTINGGNVTASAVDASGEGCINAETVTIKGGHVTALAPNNGGSINATTVAITGGIVEVPDDKLDGTNVSKSNCIVFRDKTGQVYASADGEVSIAQDWEMPSGYTLTVPSDVTLTVPEGVTLEIAGSLRWTDAKIENHGTIKLAEGGLIDPALVSVTVSDVAVEEGATATFTATASSVGADGLPTGVTYRWKQLEGDTWIDIENEAGEWLILDDARAEQDGMQYRCVVMLNGCTAYSTPATLTVIKPVDQCYSIDYAAETITADNGYEVYTAETGGDKIENGGSITSYIGQTLYIQKSGSAALGRREISIPARPAAPAAPAVVDRSDTSITIEADAGVQYRLGEDGDWTASDTGSLTFEGLDAGAAYTVYFRFPATADQFASAEGVSEFVTKTGAAAAPAVTYEVTADSVTLQYDAAWEYSSDGADWKRGEGANVFANLAPATQYTYHVRVAETEAAEASQVATVTCWTAYAAPAASEGYAINYAAETVTAQAGYEVRLSDDDEWATGPIGIAPDGTFQVRRAADEDGAPASAATTATAPSRPGAPELAIDIKSEGVTVPEGYFYNTTDADYSAEDWKPGEGASVAVQANEFIYIYKAATDSSFKSEVQTLSAPARSDAPAVPAIDYEAESLSGTEGLEFALEDAPDQWTACSANMALEDLGWTGGGVTVSFRRPAADGSYASDPVSLEVPARPAAPSFSIDNAAEGVTVPEGYLYSADGDSDTWKQGDGSLVKVGPEASVFVCTAPTGDSFRSEVQILTAPARSDAPAVPAIDYEAESLSGTAAGMEFSVDGEAWTACAEDMALEELGWDGGAVTVQFRTAATDENYASDTVALEVSARPAAPAAPAVVDRTDASITIEADAGVQYRLGEDGEWTASDTGSLTFEGLDAETTYTVCARIPAAADRFASAEASVQVTTKSAAAAAPEVGAPAVTDTSVILPHDPAWEYSTDQQSWSGTYEFTGLTPATQYTYYVRVAETEAAEASQVATVTVWTAYAAPTGVQGGEGQITGMTADMEYSGDGGATWTTCPDGSVTGLPAGEYLVRRMASGDIPASPSVTVTVTHSYPPYIPPVQTGPDWEDVIDDINGAADGEQIVVDVDGETELPGEVLEELAGSDVTLVLDMGGGVSWEISGIDIPEGTSFTAVDMGVEMGTDGIPIEVTNLVTGESGVVQVTLAHEGAFGFELTLVVPLGEENEGLVANLYHYDEDAGALRFKTSGTIDENGAARLRLDHASEWAIALDTRSHALPFVDAAEDQWYSESMRWAWLHGVMTGYADGSGRFGTNDSLTRSQMAAVLYNVAGKPDMDVSGLPADCDGGAWYVQPVAWALENGIFHGYSDDAFGPDDIITREQAACVLYNRALAAGEDVSARADLTGFSDAEELSAWAYDAMSWAVSQGIFNGTDAGELQPTRALTRAEGAAILCNWENRS